MGMLSYIAQAPTYYHYSDGYYTTGYSDEAASVAAVLAFMFLFFLIAIALYVIIALSLMKIFKKAGVKPWIAWVPFYNNWKTLELGGQQGFWAVLAIIPVISLVSAVFMYIAMYHIGKKLGKDDAFVLVAIFLPIVWYIWLAVDDSKWNEQGSTAPSLAK